MATLRIKNMVCPRCVMAVEEVLRQQGIAATEVGLGFAQVADDISSEQMQRLRTALNALGFELLESPEVLLVEQVRTAVIEWVRMEGERPLLSAFVTSRVPRDYSALSKLFSQVRGITIERYSVLQRIELAKELLCYSQFNQEEIAFRLGYANPSYFSTQFRREVGMTPSAFKKQSGHEMFQQRRPIDQL